jgi:hypothetical protein
VATCRLHCELCQVMANSGYPNNQVQVELWLSNRNAGHSPVLTTNRRPSQTKELTWDIGRCYSKCRQFLKEQQRSNFLGSVLLFVGCVGRYRLSKFRRKLLFPTSGWNCVSCTFIHRNPHCTYRANSSEAIVAVYQTIRHQSHCLECLK